MYKIPHNVVELHPAKNMCTAWCAGCDLKETKNNTVNNQIDINVQQTLNDLQLLFSKWWLRRDLEYIFWLKWNVEYKLPKIEKLFLLKNIYLSYGSLDIEREKRSHEDVVSNTLQKMAYVLSDVIDKSADHYELWTSISFIPKKIQLSEAEIEFSKKFIAWYVNFTTENKFKFWEYHLLSNSVPSVLLDKLQADILEQEPWFFESYLKDNYIQRNATNRIKVDREYEKKDLSSHLDYDVKVQKEWVDMRVWRRAISINREPQVLQEQYLRARHFIMSELDLAYAAVHPHGILVNHSSIDVKNPFLWVSHDIFRQAIKEIIDENRFSSFRWYASLLQAVVRNNVNSFQKTWKFSQEHLDMVKWK